MELFPKKDKSKDLTRAIYMLCFCWSLDKAMKRAKNQLIGRTWVDALFPP